ncbi:MAG: AraC family transcriptional regulator [Lachnospiraceae bacterium]|nr:AraC family transcriptional regulator [Lachnospiraceae bacterium]
MRLSTIGIHVKHGADFVIDRPGGTSDNLFLIFKTDAYVNVDGENTLVHPGSCILYKRFSKQLYSASAQTYVNHYIHFDCGDEEYAQSLGIRFDTPFYLRDVSEVENVLEFISHEQINTSPNRDTAIEHLLNLLVIKIADNALSSDVPPETKKHLEELKRLRSHIYANPEMYKNVSDMADEIHLSLSYFKSIYREEFDISCYDDLLNAKILIAEHHLSSTGLTVGEIASLCGYETDTCFMRSFKKRTGLTPTQFRLKHSS